MSQLTAIQGQISSIDERVQKTEAAVAGQTIDRAVSQETLTQTPPTSVASNLDQVTNDSVVPTTDFLNSNAAIQRQVDARLLEYGSIAARNVPGKLKSQRGGHGVPIKRFVPWPQNYVLVGPNKERPTYDSLKPSQWTSGVIRAALDLPMAEREKKFEYIANLMEDASDFGFESAKACHAVVLTTMEADKLTWLDTDGLDRARRHHAQRPAPRGGNDSNDSGQQTAKNSMLCKFYVEGTCNKGKSHWKNGMFYKHNCQICGAAHPNKSCKPKAKN